VKTLSDFYLGRVTCWCEGDGCYCGAEDDNEVMREQEEADFERWRVQQDAISADLMAACYADDADGGRWHG
jgi:hypothetical protein